MNQTKEEIYLVEKPIVLRVVRIYGKYRSRVYDNGKLVLELFDDNGGSARKQGKQWIYENYTVASKQE
jgi:hypothetical protein